METVKAAYWDKILTRSAIYKIIKFVKAGKPTEDQRKNNAKKNVRNQQLIAAFFVAIGSDARVNTRDSAAANGVSYETIFNILHKDLGLSKKSTRWVPKLLTDAQ